VTQKKRSSPQIEWLPKFYLDRHKTSATLCQACVADISKVSSLYFKNSLFHWRSKDVLQMSSPALQTYLDVAGKVLNDPPTLLPWDHSYWCSDCCLQVRDSLGVVAIHPVLMVSPHIKIWWVGFKSGERGNHCGSHLRLISLSGKCCCSHANDSFEVWGVAPSCWNHWRTLTTPPGRPSAVQNLPSS